MTVMHMTKNVGKPYEGKLHVRFDEGELKVKQRPAKESLLEISPLLYTIDTMFMARQLRRGLVLRRRTSRPTLSSGQQSFVGGEQITRSAPPARSAFNGGTSITGKTRVSRSR